jgi:hypothetical protein
MNKVYFFYNEEGAGKYVAHKSFKEAKEIALLSPVFDMLENPFVDIRGNLVKRYDYRDKKEYIVKTNTEGMLSTQEIVDLGIAWWQCSECGTDDLEIVDSGENYNCLSCGHSDEVPYY